MIRTRVLSKVVNQDGTVTLTTIREYRSGLRTIWTEVKDSRRVIVRDKATGRTLSEERA